MCGWTPYGLCFSPDRKKDIHRFYMIPFENIKSYVYCDQTPNLNSGWGFGINSIILAHFSRSAKKDDFWQGLVTKYTQNGYRQVLSLTARTFFKSLGVNQIQQTFYPSQVLLEGIETFFWLMWYNAQLSYCEYKRKKNKYGKGHSAVK